ncbi:MAG: dTMP kinase [Ignavibacteria bacterium]|nr:dTMP kinase [Ignavibacteria bacterium]
MLITFEGLDCSGKSTQARLLAEALQATAGTPKVHFIREPGGTEISERIRAILLDRSNAEMDHVAELLLFSASRAQLSREVITPALLRREIVICDRYLDSTTAYQGFGRGIDREAIVRINRLATAGLMPHLTLLLDIPLEEVSRRRGATGEAPDRMEGSGVRFYERVLRGYREIAADDSDRFMVIDGTKTVKEIQEIIWKEVETRLANDRKESK